VATLEGVRKLLDSAQVCQGRHPETLICQERAGLAGEAKSSHPCLVLNAKQIVAAEEVHRAIVIYFVG
jgi:hypothetical protein